MSRLPAEWSSGDVPRCQVAVIGAGVAGATAALLSARAGYRTVLIEKQKFPRQKVCGCCLNARAMDLLSKLNIQSYLAPFSNVPITATRFYLEGRSAVVEVPKGQAVSRQLLDSSLVDAAKAAGCEFMEQVSAIVLPDMQFLNEESGPDHGSSLSGSSLNGSSLNSSLVEVTSESPTKNSGLATTEHDCRQIELRSTGCSNSPESVRHLRADVVLICDGLGQTSLRYFPRLKSTAATNSRIGLGVTITRMPGDQLFREGEIHMAVSRQGYVGTVVLSESQLNVAAAVDAVFLQQHRNPADALISIFRDAGVAPPEGLASSHVRGTLPLTQTTECVADQRLFLLGDSAGYVEPFTGEGMAWALTAATRIQPLIGKVLSTGWTESVADEWQQIIFRDCGRRQRICRLLSGSLRFPLLLHPMLTACRIFPAMTRMLVRRMNQISTGQEWK